MKVLLIGSGGREHALAFKLKQSPLLKELKVFSGNGGFEPSEILSKTSMDLNDKKSVQSFVKKEAFDLVVVGPEDPLVNGISDWMEEISVLCFGPSAYCSQLEGSKDFAKKLMQELGIPTAAYKTFIEYKSAREYALSQKLPLVIKADGLAAGKGVSVCTEYTEVETALSDIFEKKKFGASGNQVVIEEFMDGEEASVFALCDGENYLMLPAAQDHKRAFDEDRGPNTGGMGAYAPAPIVTQELYKKIAERVFDPMLKGLKAKGHPYKGLLYAGLMIGKDNELRIVEFNCRFGDPETQVILLLLETDLLSILLNCAKGNLGNTILSMKAESAVTVVLAAEGYPSEYKKDIPLSLKSTPEGIVVFHAGTHLKENQLYSNGGRVLNITATGKDLAKAIQNVYRYIDELKIDGLFYRKDIGHRAL